MKYSIGYINGHNLKFETFETSAKDKETAIHHLYQEKGDFDHQIIWCKDGMKEYPLPELGYFTESQIEAMKKALDGTSYMNFQISSSNYAGNHILIVQTDYEEDEEEIKSFFLHVALSQFSQLV